MKRILLFAVMLAWAGGAWGASTTYYVSPSGDNTDGSTWAKAYAIPSLAVTAANAVAPTAKTAGAGHTIYIAPASYNDYIALSNANFAGGTVIGTSAHGVTTDAAKGQVIFTNTANTHVVVNQDNVTLKNISSTGITTVGKRSFQIGAGASSANFVGTNLYSYNCTGGEAFYFAGAGNLTLTNSKVWGNGADLSPIGFWLASSGSVNYLIATPSDAMGLGGAAYFSLNNGGTGTITVNNSILIGPVRISNATTGTLNLNNNVIGSYGSVAITRYAGTLNYANNILIPYWINKAVTSGTVTDGGGNLTNAGSIFTRNARTGYIVPFVDDSSSLVYAQSLETLLASKGMKGSYTVAGKDVAANVAALQTMFNNGTMSLHPHSWSHSSIANADNTFDITKPTGSTLGTVVVSRTDNTITLTDDGGAHVVSSFRTKTLAAIRTEIAAFVNGPNHWAVGTMASALEDTTLGESFSETVSGNNNIQLLIDTVNTGDSMTGFYKVEMRDPLNTFQSNITGYTAKGFVTPGGYSSANAETGLKNAGYIGSRPLYGSYGSTTNLLASMNAYRFAGFMNNFYVVGANDNATISNVKAICQYLGQAGGAVAFLAHSTSETTIAQWTTILNTIALYPEIQVISFDDLLDKLKASPYSSADNVTYTRTWTDTSDFRLLSSSPAINAGVDVGLTTDYRGMAVPQRGIPDIGAYEFGPGDPGYGGAYRGRMGIHWMW